MLAARETEDEPRAQQRQADRADRADRAAPWVDYPPTPTWHFVGVAAVTVAVVVVVLAAVALLRAARSTDFGFLRDHLGVSDSELSKQMSALDQAGYVRIRKRGRGSRATTTYQLTREGRAACTRHREALRALLER